MAANNSVASLSVESATCQELPQGAPAADNSPTLPPYLRQGAAHFPAKSQSPLPFPSQVHNTPPLKGRRSLCDRETRRHRPPVLSFLFRDLFCFCRYSSDLSKQADVDAHLVETATLRREVLRIILRGNAPFVRVSVVPRKQCRPCAIDPLLAWGSLHLNTVQHSVVLSYQRPSRNLAVVY